MKSVMAGSSIMANIQSDPRRLQAHTIPSQLQNSCTVISSVPLGPCNQPLFKKQHKTNNNKKNTIFLSLPKKVKHLTFTEMNDYRFCTDLY